jgi:hypothetical protein
VVTRLPWTVVLVGLGWSCGLELCRLRAGPSRTCMKFAELFATTSRGLGRGILHLDPTHEPAKWIIRNAKYILVTAKD